MEGRGSYILKYPLLNGKAEQSHFDLKRKKITGPVFFPMSLNDIFLIKS